MTYEEARRLAQEVKLVLDLPALYPAGSLRRQCPIVNDLDFVIRAVAGEKNIIAKRLGKFFGFNVTDGEAKNEGELFGVHIDIIIADPENYGAALLHLTGSKQYNVICRARAKQFGWKLNQYGLWEGNHLVCDCSAEYYIQAALEMGIIGPRNRDL